MSAGDISLEIKYTFISFAQQYFEQDERYTWSSDIKTTGIIIADKNAIDIGVAVKRPSIVLSRGSFSFMNVGIRQDFPGKGYLQTTGQETLSGPNPSSDSIKTGLYKDLISGSVRFTVLSKSGVLADALANDLTLALFTHKHELREKGIHQLSYISVGEESILKSDADIHVSAVPVDIRFTKNVTVARGEKAYNCRVYIDTIEEFENIGFRVDTNGTQITFETAPDAETVLRITYVDAITLETLPNQLLVGTPNGTLKTFTVPAGGSIYGYYTLYADEVLTMTLGN